MDASISLESKKIALDNGRKISLVYCIPKKGISACSAGLVIAPGVRGSMKSFLVSYFHREMALRGFVTAKFNFPYMEGHWLLPRRPDPKKVLVACYRRVLDDIRSRLESPRKLFMGGLSMGAAVASHVVTDTVRVDVDGLFFLSYPIHMPGRPEELGTRHLFGISKPMLFISGTRDSTGQRDRLEDVVSKLGPRAQLYLVEGGSHRLNTGGGRKIYGKTLKRCATALEVWINSQISPNPDPMTRS